jgi:rod shape-determining protein MreC
VRAPSRRILILGALAVAGSLALHQPLRHAALTLLRLPFTCVRAAAAILLELPRLPGLAQENRQLREELMRQRVEAARLREAARRAEQAGALLAASPFAAQALVASVIGRSTLPAQQTVLLDAGERLGLTLDTVVMDAAGLIGRVVDVQPETALILLLTDAESRVAAVVERSRETGLLIGRGGGRCELIYLEAEADVQAGDQVVTAGLGGPFPKGLPLGTVVGVARDERSGSTSASVKPSARLGKAEEVLCLPPVRP